MDKGTCKNQNSRGLVFSEKGSEMNHIVRLNKKLVIKYVNACVILGPQQQDSNELKYANCHFLTYMLYLHAVQSLQCLSFLKKLVRSSVLSRVHKLNVTFLVSIN